MFWDSKKKRKKNWTETEYVYYAVSYCAGQCIHFRFNAKLLFTTMTVFEKSKIHDRHSSAVFFGDPSFWRQLHQQEADQSTQRLVDVLKSVRSFDPPGCDIRIRHSPTGTPLAPPHCSPLSTSQCRGSAIKISMYKITPHRRLSDQQTTQLTLLW